MSWVGAPVDCNCYCPLVCDLEVTMSYSVTFGTISVVGRSPSGKTRFHFRVYKNGVLILEVLDVSNSSNTAVSVAELDVVTATATSVFDEDCVASASCTRKSTATIPSCTYLSPPGSTGGCYSAAELEALYIPTTSRSAEISGLTGPMAALNGTYTVSCASASAGSSVSWSGGGYTYNRGSVGVSWSSQFGYAAQVSCQQSNIDSCILSGVICNPSDATRRIGNVRSESLPNSATFNFQFKPASCGTCVNQSRLYESSGTISDTTTSNGSPAESAVITWI